MTPRLHPRVALVLVAAFLVALAAPGAVMFSGLDRDVPAGENRELAPRPAPPATWQALRAFPAAAARYFEDHFGLRARLVRWQALVRLRLLGTSASPDVIVGRDGWLFYAGDGAAEDMASAVPFTRDELEAWRTTLEHTQDWMEARGIAYVFVLAPDKHAVYPELLPPSIHRVGAETRTDALVRYLRDHSTVPVLDLRGALMAAKGRERIYHRTDTHWNDRGAFAASQALWWMLAPRLGAPANGRGALMMRNVTVPGLDLAGMLGVAGAVTEVDLRLVPRVPRRARIVEPARPDARLMDARVVTEQDAAELPRAVVFRDSFGSALIPFLSEHFSRAVYLWQYNVDPGVVEAERPRVVIQEWVGRRLSTERPYDPFVTGAGESGESGR
jgi:alginate O-acetyltransferase complex protein AlgJ